MAIINIILGYMIETEQLEKSGKKTMKKIILTIAVLSFTVMCTYTAMAVTPDKEETLLWELIKDTRDIEELDVYLEIYPKGEYVTRVIAKKWAIVKSEQSIEQIDKFVRIHAQNPYLIYAEDAIWDMIKAQSNMSVIQNYIKKYPKSRYRKEAENWILQIEDKNRWRVVKNSNSLDQLKAFIKEHPESRFFNSATEMLWHLVKNSNDIAIVKDFVASFPESKLAYKAEEIIWALVEATNDIQTINNFLAQNPGNRFTGLAKVKLIRLNKRAATLQLSDTHILDNVTHLVWQRKDLGKGSWEEAEKKCSKSRLQDWENWRLPHKSEFSSLFNIKHFISNFIFTDFWTATTYAKDQLGAWMVSLELPQGNVDYKKNSHHILCVRNLD
ncbi:MAG: DUF1566 domain-containing protein [SAR324 cluster bacterium]|nr:DUF1566 domain-containing protein [SAR324 cluster bacterium]